MLFNSIDFAIFLPIVLAVYWFIFGHSFHGQNAVLIIFMPPSTPAYVGSLDAEQFRTVIATGEQLAHDNDLVEFHNFMDTTGFVDADFGDADHWGPAGAAKLSGLLDDLMDRPILH